MTTTVGKRIKKGRLEANLSQQDLADAISNIGDKKKISRTAIAQWESGVTQGIEAANLLKATQVLNLRPEWVQFGVGNMRPDFNKDPITKTEFVIPILNYSQAINHTGHDNVEDYIGLDRKLASVASREAFAIIVEDESMLPIFKPSDLVIIDPKVNPKPGEIVAVKLPYDELILLRKYRPLANINKRTFNAYELVPLNEDWPRITIQNESSGNIIGVLIEHRCRRRI